MVSQDRCSKRVMYVVIHNAINTFLVIYYVISPGLSVTEVTVVYFLHDCIYTSKNKWVNACITMFFNNLPYLVT